MRITDWDDAYKNAAYIPEADAIAAHWETASGVFRAAHEVQHLSYGPHPRMIVDLFRPQHEPRGLCVFVHGGFWQMLSGADFAHLAAGPLASGQAVALVTYPLAPDVDLPRITDCIRGAICEAASHVAGPIYLAGHSAGGHLVTRMICQGVLPDALAARVQHVMSISGVHDLRPLLRTEMAETLSLTPEVARIESPAFLSPIQGACVTCVVGADERPEFLRQNALLANIWTRLGADMHERILPQENHFGILASLEQADGVLTQTLLRGRPD